jgi:hypothetical protein
MGKRKVDALTIKSGPAEDGAGAAPPTATPVSQVATDYTTLIIVGVIVVAVVLVSAIVYLRRRKKTRVKTIDRLIPEQH